MWRLELSRALSNETDTSCSSFGPLAHSSLKLYVALFLFFNHPGGPYLAAVLVLLSNEAGLLFPLQTLLAQSLGSGPASRLENRAIFFAISLLLQVSLCTHLAHIYRCTLALLCRAAPFRLVQASVLRNDFAFAFNKFVCLSSFGSLLLLGRFVGLCIQLAVLSSVRIDLALALLVVLCISSCRGFGPILSILA
mmetsp:Transcript_15888/g.50655  ORF Transcript_15888/g.50655 Transcript_15888/m.50655 type:complete len:194 (-) Transcript_15888:347-928(-)